MALFLPTRKKIAWWIIATSIIALIICVVSFVWSLYIVRICTRTQGHIVDLVQQGADERGPISYPVFSFIDSSGREHTVRLPVGSSPPQEKVGDVIPVLYRSAQPERAKIGTSDYMWGLSLSTGIAGSSWLCIGLLLLFWPSIIQRLKYQVSIKQESPTKSLERTTGGDERQG
jgi:hypothetical protein